MNNASIRVIRCVLKLKEWRLFRLILKTRFVLEFKKFFYVPSFSRNLISISKLIVVGYGFLFVNSTLSILKIKFILVVEH